MVFMPYLLTLRISLPSRAAFKWLFWNLCGLAPLLRSCLFFMFAPKTNSARFVRQDLPFMELGRYVFISSYFSRCWVISPLLTSLKSCLWLKNKQKKIVTFCRFGARFSAGGSECVLVHQFSWAFISADNLLQIWLGSCLSSHRCSEMFALYQFLFSSFYLPERTQNLSYWALNLSCCPIKQRGLKVRPPRSALPPSPWCGFASVIIHAPSSSLLGCHRKLCFCACHLTSRFPHERQPGEII